jgi:hypothetical protein
MCIPLKKDRELLGGKIRFWGGEKETQGVGRNLPGI